MNAEQARNLLNIHQPRVLRNFTRLIEEGITLIPRVPLIPGYTLDIGNFQAILDFLAPFKLPEIHLLPFHQFGEAKYRLLNRPYKMSDVMAPDEAELEPFRQLAIDAGYRVITGG